jgi:poly [ADP-ribose] polymerase
MSKKYAMLVKVNVGDNNNKFYEIIWNDDDSVTARYGRNGDNGVTEQKGYGEAAFNKVYKAKTGASKGYKEVDVLTNQGGTTPKAVTKSVSSLAEIAKRDVSKGNPLLANLMDQLAKINKYQLLQATGDQIDIVDGVVQTVLGPITLDAVAKARSELLLLDKFITNNDFGDKFGEHLNQYLTYVPQKVPRKRGWDQNFFTEVTSFQAQNGLLDQIEGSIKNYKPIDPVVDGSLPEPAKIFGHSLELVEDGATIDRIKKFYASNMNRSHACSHLTLKRVYAVSNPDALNKYESIYSKIGNEKELWHGTQAVNILSILKGGLIIPNSGGNYNITGRMFYNGIYHSDQSTKALNYAYGYWNGTKNNNCFMFLCRTAMGKEYIPNAPFSKPIPKGYDSCFAIGGKSGVQNNEMIVYDVNQTYLNYLCEFDS